MICSCLKTFSLISVIAGVILMQGFAVKKKKIQLFFQHLEIVTLIQYGHFEY